MAKKIFPACIASLELIMEYYRKIISDSGMAIDNAKKFELALEEATVNVISYAYQSDNGLIEIEHQLSKDFDELEIHIKDSGKPFNPCSFSEKEETFNLESQKIGGLGIHFIRSLSDRIKYRYSDNMNILTLTKSIISQEN